MEAVYVGLFRVWQSGEAFQLEQRAQNGHGKERPGRLGGLRFLLSFSSLIFGTSALLEASFPLSRLALNRLGDQFSAAVPDQ